MRERLRFLCELFKATVGRWVEVEGYRLGASFSFYATFAIFPLLLLSVTAIGFVLGDDATTRDRLLAEVASPDAAVRRVLEDTLASMQAARSARGTSVVVAVGSLLFTATGAFVELDWALNRIWDVPPRKAIGLAGTVVTFVLEQLSGLAIVGSIGITLLASLVGSSLLSVVAAHTPSKITPALLHTAELTLSIALLCAVLSLAFHLVPRTRPPLASVIGGAALTAVLLAMLKELFATYFSRLTSYSAYGVVGGVLALATWIYLSSQIIFLGASLTRVQGEMTGAASLAGGIMETRAG